MTSRKALSLGAFRLRPVLQESLAMPWPMSQDYNEAIQDCGHTIAGDSRP
jgi:hypothetical protein